MKKQGTLFFTLFILSTAFSQKEGYKHPVVLNICYLANDFKNNSLFGDPGKMDPGIGISCLAGINNHLDWSIGLNGSFPDSALRKTVSGKRLLFLQSEAIVRARLIAKDHWIQPYFFSGAAVSSYSKDFDVYALCGAGLQFNYKDVFLLLNTGYHLAFTKNLNNHYQYAIGLAHTIGKRKKKKLPSHPVVVYKKMPADSDGDGLNDEEDACPDIPGTVEYKGCPPPQPPLPLPPPVVVKGEEKKEKIEITDKINRAAKKIFFKTGSYELLSISDSALNSIVQVLQENEHLAVTIEGHTDNRGTKASNYKLSSNRAQTVLNYLTSKGVATHRLQAVGYGQDRPVANNSTEEGRAANRRVEVKIE